MKDVCSEPDRAQPADASALAESPSRRRHQGRAREARPGYGSVDLSSTHGKILFTVPEFCSTRWSLIVVFNLCLDLQCRWLTGCKSQALCVRLGHPCRRRRIHLFRIGLLDV